MTITDSTTADVPAATRTPWLRLIAIDAGIFVLLLGVIGGSGLGGWLPPPLPWVAFFSPLVSLVVIVGRAITSYARGHKRHGRVHLVAALALLLPALAVQWMVVMGVAASAMPRHD